MTKSIARRRIRAFTLVELLVVIGIIAILVGVLLPVLGSARKASEKATCLASLAQIHNAFKLYQIDYKGAWPVSVMFYSSKGVQRDKRYHDFIGKYLIGNQTVTKPDGTKVTDNNMNFNGSCSSSTFGSVAAYQTHGEFGTDEDPIWLGTMRDRKSVLWGCPSWNKMGFAVTTYQYDYGINNGYSMNFFLYAPNDLNAAGSDVDATRTARIIDAIGTYNGKTYGLRYGDAASNAGGVWPGNFYKMTNWSRPGDRALLFDGVFNAGYTDAAWIVGNATTIDGVTWTPTDPGATLPKVSNEKVWFDWNRHAKPKPGKVKNSDQGMNVLYCDGHAATVSAREAYQAVRFK